MMAEERNSFLQRRVPMAKRLIIPGLNGSGSGHWQEHWLRDDPDAVLVEQQDWARPDLELWGKTVTAKLFRYPGALLIAHSFGAVVAASLATGPARHLIAGALLVAPCDIGRASSLHPEQIAPHSMPQDKLPFPTILVASRNDPYMSFDAACFYAEHYGASLVDLGRAGHVNIDSGYGRWNFGYHLADDLQAGWMPLRTSMHAG
jgi:hypothetical protein